MPLLTIMMVCETVPSERRTFVVEIDRYSEYMYIAVSRDMLFQRIKM